MKAIKVKYLGPTNFMGSRWKASIKDGHGMIAATVDNDSGLSFDDNANEACMALQRKLGWIDNCFMVQGVYDNDHYFVMLAQS